MKEQIVEDCIRIYRLKNGTLFVETRDISKAALDGAHKLIEAGADEDFFELAKKVQKSLLESLIDEGIAIHETGTDKYFEAVPQQWPQELEVEK